MAVLQDIIEGATGSATPTTELLRMVRVLAARGRVDDLAEWVKNELYGYSEDDPLPDYRGPFPSLVMGTFDGPFRSSLKARLARTGLSAEIVSKFFVVQFRQSISELETLAEAEETPQRGLQWPTELVMHFNSLIEEGTVAHPEMHVLRSAMLPIAKAQIVAVVNGVRNRILEFALALEDTSPELGSQPAQQAGAREEISAKFNMTIVANNVNIGETVTPNYGVSIVAGDHESLHHYLRAIGVSDATLRSELVEAADEARKDGDVDVSRSSRLKKAITKATGQLGMAAVGNLIQEVIKQWIGG
jgi:hypothetical protein